MRRITRWPLIASALAALGTLLGASPAYAISVAPETPHSPNADAIATTYWVTLIVAAALIVAINAALIVAVLRFRARRGRQATRLAAGRGALRRPVTLLVALAVPAFVFGVVMTNEVREVEPSGPSGLESVSSQTAQVGLRGLPPVDPTEAEPPDGADPIATAPLEINAIAQRWLWRFEYPGGEPGQQVFSYGELVVPVDTTVILNVGSTDVSHTWWVPALGGQVQATPGSTSRTWFKADEEGRYPGRSTIFSGTGFPSLRSWVRVVDVPEYLSHVEGLEADLREAQDAVAGDENGATDAAGSEEDGP